MPLWLVLYQLIVLHNGEGGQVYINPAEIISLREGGADRDKLFTPTVKCMINTSDGKYITVKETCSEVREIIRTEIERLQKLENP